MLRWGEFVFGYFEVGGKVGGEERMKGKGIREG